MPLVLVRPPGAGFAAALSEHPQSATIDVDRAREQHRGYVGALRASGVTVIELPAEDDLPDACFVEDTAVVIGGDALLCTPGAASRAPEPETLLPTLTRHVRSVTRLPPGATLDGGDVLRPDSQAIYVGRSARSNAAGIEALTRFAAERGVRVRAIEVPPGFLHLQTAVTALAADALIGTPEALAAPEFAQFALRLAVPPDEVPGASVLALPGRRVLLAAGCARTRSAIAAAGYLPIEVPLDEFTKADGGPTCLALRID